jgi:hypothetical protein
VAILEREKRSKSGIIILFFILEYIIYLSGCDYALIIAMVNFYLSKINE